MRITSSEYEMLADLKTATDIKIEANERLLEITQNRLDGLRVQSEELESLIEKVEVEYQ